VYTRSKFSLKKSISELNTYTKIIRAKIFCPALPCRSGQGVRASGQPCPVTVSEVYAEVKLNGIEYRFLREHPLLDLIILNKIESTYCLCLEASERQAKDLYISVA
jgi:hypothetical protein